MRSIREGKSSVTTFTWMPIFCRSSWIIAAMRSRALLPALVMIENTTALPSLSFSVPFSRRKPSDCSAFNAASGRIGFGLQLGVEPELVCRRNWTHGWLRVSAIDDAAPGRRD